MLGFTSSTMFLIFCSSLVYSSSATSVRSVYSATLSKPTYSTSSYNPYPSPTKDPKCPYPIKMLNPGFESGKLSPWAIDNKSSINATVVSPSRGSNKSKHALRVDIHSGTGHEFFMTQDTQGVECYGYHYNISYSWNWLHYTGPEGPPQGPDSTDYCRFDVYTGYTGALHGRFANPSHYGSRKPGWHSHSYIAIAENMECYNNVGSAFCVQVQCVGYNYTEVLPGLTILLDNLNIERVLEPPTRPSGYGCDPLP